METLFYYLSTGAMYAVVLVLLAGLWVMMRGTSPNLSQKLMRWRVGLQFVAVVLLVAYAYVQHL
ncbi:twin transmembrane helix small protein [uncultured Hyphomicrobium sp.]|uniref:twin transmembrane helix small protein n=1 Tax=uncultured Hyphomicrobium sp. TaxID=194373 RepID=UPI0025F1ECA3|nr:twin transmembrane helix small protein [uncultured Hyphomicrobium sp.]